MSGFIDGARFFILEIILDYKFAESNQDVIILEAIKSFIELGYVLISLFEITSISETLDSRSLSRYIRNNEGGVITFQYKY